MGRIEKEVELHLHAQETESRATATAPDLKTHDPKPLQEKVDIQKTRVSITQPMTDSENAELRTTSLNLSLMRPGCVCMGVLMPHVYTCEVSCVHTHHTSAQSTHTCSCRGESFTCTSVHAGQVCPGLRGRRGRPPGPPSKAVPRVHFLFPPRLLALRPDRRTWSTNKLERPVA